MESLERRGFDIESTRGRAVARSHYNEPAARGAERISQRNQREVSERSRRREIENVATAIAADVAENDAGERGESFGSIETDEAGEAWYVVTTVDADGTVLNTYRVPIADRDELLSNLDALGVDPPTGKRDYPKRLDLNPDDTEEDPDLWNAPTAAVA